MIIIFSIQPIGCFAENSENESIIETFNETFSNVMTENSTSIRERYYKCKDDIAKLIIKQKIIKGTINLFGIISVGALFLFSMYSIFLNYDEIIQALKNYRNNVFPSLFDSEEIVQSILPAALDWLEQENLGLLWEIIVCRDSSSIKSKEDAKAALKLTENFKTKLDNSLSKNAIRLIDFNFLKALADEFENYIKMMLRHTFKD